MIIEYKESFDLNELGIYYFYASWNNSCNISKELIEKLSNEIKNINIIKINTTKYPYLKKKYSINRIPSYAIIKNCSLVSKIDGGINSYSLLKWAKQIYLL